MTVTHSTLHCGNYALWQKGKFMPVTAAQHSSCSEHNCEWTNRINVVLMQKEGASILYALGQLSVNHLQNNA